MVFSWRILKINRFAASSTLKFIWILTTNDTLPQATWNRIIWTWCYFTVSDVSLWSRLHLCFLFTLIEFNFNGQRMKSRWPDCHCARQFLGDAQENGPPNLTKLSLLVPSVYFSSFIERKEPNLRYEFSDRKFKIFEPIDFTCVINWHPFRLYYVEAVLSVKCISNLPGMSPHHIICSIFRRVSQWTLSWTDRRVKRTVFGGVTMTHMDER